MYYDPYGDGFYDTLKEYGSRVYHTLVGPRQGPPPDVRNFLNDFGDFQITKINVCRSPIFKEIELAARILTLGVWDKRKQEFNYDKLFHLYILITLQKGHRTIIFRIEKNQVVFITHSQKDVDTDCMFIPIDINKHLTFSQFISNGQQYQGDDFWLYDPLSNNCQDFVLSLLKGNHLGDNTIYNFVKQNADQLVVGPFKHIAKFTTNIASRVDILLRGLGFAS